MHFNEPEFSPGKAVFLKKGTLLKKIDLTEILYIQSETDVTYIVTEAVRHSSSQKISGIISKLESTFFLQVHRSFVVNFQKITAIDIERKILYIGGVEIPFSRRNKKQILERIRIFS